MSSSRFFSLTFLAGLAAASAQAAICDYRPSQVLGGATSASAATAGTVVAASGGAAKAAGVYTLVHSTSGLTMVGGTWAGSSGAGTAGIIAGTGGTIGTSVAVLTAPATIAAAGAIAVVVGTFEGACYFTDSSRAEYAEIDAIMRDIEMTAPDAVFRYVPSRPGRREAEIRVNNPDYGPAYFDTYQVKNLYIVNGVLMHRDWGFNTEIGLIGRITEPQQQVAKAEP